MIVASAVELGDGCQPLMTFTGDEAVTPEQYKGVMDSDYNYLHLVRSIAFAAEGYGLELDHETLERWKRVGAAASYLDTFLDESPDRQEAARLFDQGIRHVLEGAEKPEAPDWAEPQLETSVDLMNNSVAVLPEDRQETLLVAAGLIAEISVAKSRCTDPSEYLDVLSLEGQLSGVLTSESVSDDVYKQPQFDDFALWAMCLGEAGTLADSALDLKRDYEKGLTKVRPTLRNRAKIAVPGLKRAGFALHTRQSFQATLMAHRAGKKLISTCLD